MQRSRALGSVLFRDGHKKLLWIVYEHKSSLGLLSLTAWNFNLKFTCVRLLKLSNTENIGKPSTWNFSLSNSRISDLLERPFLSRGYVHFINSFYISVSIWLILPTTKIVRSMQETRLLNNRALHKLKTIKSWVKQCYFVIWLWICLVISSFYIIQRAPSMLVLVKTMFGTSLYWILKVIMKTNSWNQFIVSQLANECSFQ